ncbi:MAG: CAP domain-containing protein, partial [Actinomycetota bacterium]
TPAPTPSGLGAGLRTALSNEARLVIVVAAGVALAVVGLLVAAFLVDDGSSTTTDALVPLVTPAGGEAEIRSGGVTSDDGRTEATPGVDGDDGGGNESGGIGTAVMTPAEDDVRPATAGAGSTPDRPQPPTTATSDGDPAPPSTAVISSPPAPAPSGPTTAPATTAESTADPTTSSTSPAAADPAPSSAPSTATASTAAPTTAPVTTAAPTTAPATTPAPAPPATGGDGAIQQQILQLTNAERAKAGCPALSLDSRLTAAADGHAEDMAANNYFDHRGRNGSSLGSRVTAAGYDWRRVGENIAAGQRDAEAVLRSWMGSSGHRANILDCRFGELGVGYALRGSTPYWVQVFASR